MTPKIEKFLARHRPETPCLLFDLDILADNYRRLSAALPGAEIYYAVKANPAAPVLHSLAGLGSKFDAASLVEIDRCLAAGADPADIAFGNTIKKQSDIAAAFALGVRLFSFDCAEELEKLAIAAPGAKVVCRIFVGNDGARWPLGAKFGCAADAACDLLISAQSLGLAAHGVAFHVGSQQTDLASWDLAIGQAAMIFTELRERGIELALLNIGGGIPVRYAEEVPGEANDGEIDTCGSVSEWIATFTNEVYRIADDGECIFTVRRHDIAEFKKLNNDTIDRIKDEAPAMAEQLAKDYRRLIRMLSAKAKEAGE